MSNSTKKNVKALYIMVFSPDKWDPDKLKEVTRAAEEMLKGKDPTFKQLFDDQMMPNTRIDISNVQYMPFTNTPEWMQTMFTGWFKKGNVEFIPMPGKNLFTHGMKDADGKEVFLFFYFEMNEVKETKVASQSTTNTVQEQTAPDVPVTKSRPKWIIIAAVVGAVTLCICGAATILPVIFFGN